MKIFAAPIQGYTDAPYRHFHALLYAPADIYCSPFLHIEHGEPRKRDIRDITSPLNSNHNLLPQILFRDTNEFTILSTAVKNAGHKAIDLNLGCPFPPQVKKGRGAAMINNPDCLREIGDIIKSDSETSYSIKMRLGVDDSNDWRNIVNIVNDIPLTHVTIHPRIASQQYSGELFINEFSDMLKTLRHPVVYNGNIMSPYDIDAIGERYPTLHGIMIGRGILSSPSIIEEWKNRSAITYGDKISRIIELHSNILAYYESCLCGDTQILAKIKPFWDYHSELIGKKYHKLIRKSSSLNAYKNAITYIGNQ